MPFDPIRLQRLRCCRPTRSLKRKAVLRKAIAGNKVLAELKGTGELIPNHDAILKSRQKKAVYVARFPYGQ